MRQATSLASRAGAISAATATPSPALPLRTMGSMTLSSTPASAARRSDSGLEPARQHTPQPVKTLSNLPQQHSGTAGVPAAPFNHSPRPVKTLSPLPPSTSGSAGAQAALPMTGGSRRPSSPSGPPVTSAGQSEGLHDSPLRRQSACKTIYSMNNALSKHFIPVSREKSPTAAVDVRPTAAVRVRPTDAVGVHAARKHRVEENTVGIVTPGVLMRAPVQDGIWRVPVDDMQSTKVVNGKITAMPMTGPTTMEFNLNQRGHYLAPPKKPAIAPTTLPTI